MYLKLQHHKQHMMAGDVMIFLSSRQAPGVEAIHLTSHEVYEIILDLDNNRF